MNFVLLWDQDQINDAQERFQLFHEDCLPHPQRRATARYALITDVEETGLAVLPRAYFKKKWCVRMCG